MTVHAAPRTGAQRTAPEPPSPRVLDWLVLVLFVLVPLAVGGVGSWISAPYIDGWYAQADKAPWTPPNPTFGIVWTILYVMIGVAGWLVWRRRQQSWARPGLAFFVAQMLLNAIWSPLFFAGQEVLGPMALWLALVVILTLVAAVIGTMLTFRRVSPVAAGLLAPYLLWVAYASTLNVYIAVAN